ncbi:MAG: Peptidase [Parcubacteria group bacterium]|nr:Peptidase [Parcubacteria group bacterium]
MKNYPRFILFLVAPVLFFIGFDCAGANEIDLKIIPATVIQGEPLMLIIDGIKDISAIKKITFDRQSLGMFMYKKKPTALIGIDLRKKAGSYELTAQFADGQTIKKITNVGAREKIEAPLGIPKKLGGDTKESQNKLVSTLAEENKILANIRTGKKAFWSEKFVYPLSNIFVTDDYGYSRKTGEYSIAHKGTDLRAKEGTPVAAMNRGVVRIARTFRNYGKVIVIDHGLGLMTFYLHLSKMNVNEGELVKRGQIMGLSGQTGYALSPHLHLSIRINNNSIDPIKFMELFK